MSEKPRRPLRDRVVFRVLRALLWPIARLRPKSSWARMYQRLRSIEDSTVEDLARRPIQRLARPSTLFVLLVSAALVLWLRDVLHKPAPPPAVAPHVHVTSTR